MGPTQTPLLEVWHAPPQKGCSDADCSSFYYTFPYNSCYYLQRLSEGPQIPRWTFLTENKMATLSCKRGLMLRVVPVCVCQCVLTIPHYQILIVCINIKWMSSISWEILWSYIVYRDVTSHKYYVCQLQRLLYVLIGHLLQISCCLFRPQTFASFLKELQHEVQMNALSHKWQQLLQRFC